MALVPSGPQLSVKYTLTGPDGTVATFNDPTDANFVGGLTEVTGLDSPEVRENAENITGMDGGIHGNFYHGRRPITLSGTIYNVPSNENRNIKITKLLQASNALREDATLEWTPAGGERQFVKVRRQQACRITGGWSKSFQLLLVAADPRIYGTAEQSTSVTTPIVQEFINTGANPKGCATDGTHIYWTSGEAFIGRALVTGGSIEPKWVAIGEISNGVAVDAGHVYWNSPTGIGRCTIAGGTVENKWLAVTTFPGAGVAVDAGHVYWAKESGSIGRATIAGGTIEPNWISLITNPQGLCVDAGHIYWADRKNGRIGRATIAGGSVEVGWIANAGSEPTYPSVTGTNIYWCCYAGNQVRRANLSGEEMMQNFLATGTAGPYGSAITGSGETATLFVTNFNEGTISSVPIKGYVSISNTGSEITYPIVIFAGKPKNFEIVNSTTSQKVVINYNPGLPIQVAGGLPNGIAYVTNDGTSFWYMFGTHFGKININGTESNPGFGSVLGKIPIGIAANGSKVYLAVDDEAGGKPRYRIYPSSKVSYSFEELILSSETEELFATAANESNLYYASTTAIIRSTLAGGSITSIVAGANVAKGSSILVTATKLYWVNTSGEIKESTLAGASVKTVVASTEATSLAVDSSHLYWTNTKSGTIGRSTLTGTEVQPEWVSGQAEPRGIYVSATSASWINSLTGTINTISLAEPVFTGVIDMLNRTVSTASGSIYGSVNFAETEWFGFVPAENRVNVIEQLKSEGMVITLQWRNAWI